MPLNLDVSVALSVCVVSSSGVVDGESVGAGVDSLGLGVGVDSLGVGVGGNGVGGKGAIPVMR